MMKKEEFQQFLHDLCTDVTGHQLDFTWRNDKDKQPTLLVSPLLEPKVAKELLSQLQKQDTVRFWVVKSPTTPGFSRLVASTNSIKGIDESIVRTLNEISKTSIPLKKEYTWQQLTSTRGISHIGIDLNFSYGYSVDYTAPKLSAEEIGCITSQLADLERMLEFRFGIKTTYEEHKSGDYFFIPEGVTYSAYSKLLPNVTENTCRKLREVPSQVDLLLKNSSLFLDNAPAAETETVKPPAALQLP